MLVRNFMLLPYTEWCMLSTANKEARISGGARAGGGAVLRQDYYVVSHPTTKRQVSDYDGQVPP